MTKKEKISIGICIMAIICLVLFSEKESEKAVGSVNSFNEYHATTTSVGYKNNALVGPARSANAASGSIAGTCTQALGSVVITGAGSLSGNLEFYDATTTNITLRAPSMSTSSITIATINNAGTANVWTYDRALLNGGLIMSFNPTGAVNTFANGVASTTVTCR